LLYRDGGGLTGIGDKTLSFDIALIVNQGVSPFVAKTGSSPSTQVIGFNRRVPIYINNSYGDIQFVKPLDRSWFTHGDKK